jgi:prolipoprotein diacylglyceryltransferase
MEFPHIDPVAFAIGPLKVHWYGLMYMFGFAAAWLLGVYRAKQPGSGWTKDQVGDLVFYGAWVSSLVAVWVTCSSTTLINSCKIRCGCSRCGPGA